MAPQVGFKMVIKYTPSTSMVYPDPEGGNWATALGEYAGPGDPGNFGLMGTLYSYNSDALANAIGNINITAQHLSISNSQDNESPVLQLVLVFDESPDTYDLSSLDAILDDAVSNSAAAATLIAFVSGAGVMEPAGNFTELWSSEGVGT